jgi:type I restriction enzyme, S subunit
VSEASHEPLPRGWSAAKLADIVCPRAEKADPQATPDVQFIGMEQVQAHTMRLLGTVPAVSMKSSANVFQATDVIYGRLRAYLNKVYQPDFPGLCSGEFIVLPESSAVLGRFLKYVLNSGEFVRFASQLNTGDRPRVDWDQIKQFEVRLPSRSEQGHIADMLDELLSDVDAGVVALERLCTKLNLYRAAVLKAAVEGKLVSGHRPYPVHRIADAIESLGQGWSPKCESRPAEVADEWAVIKTTAIQPLRFSGEHNKALPIALTPRSHLELQAGDLLITRAGPRSRVGIACLVKMTRPRLMLCDKAYRLRCRPNTLMPAFLEVVLNAPNIVMELDALKTGINDSGLNLTQDRFCDLRVPFPSLAEQAAVVEVVESQLSVIDHIAGDLDTRLISAQALRQSILRHAFSGQLVPQDPNNEPASELLKRVGAEREECARLSRVAKQAKPKTKAPYRRATQD